MGFGVGYHETTTITMTTTCHNSGSPLPGPLLYSIPPSNPYHTQGSTPEEGGIKPDHILIVHQLTLAEDSPTNWTPSHRPQTPHEIHEAIYTRIRLYAKHLGDGLSAISTHPLWKENGFTHSWEQRIIPPTRHTIAHHEKNPKNSLPAILSTPQP